MRYTNSAVVIGNGESRSNLNLTELKSIITLIGCNAIHRDLRVDHLICCDNRMVHEVLSRKKSRKIEHIYTRERYFRDHTKLHHNERVKLVPPIPYNGTQKPDQPEHWGSGPYAVLLAAHLNFSTVNLVGFDLHGKNSLVNNVYKDTQNYLQSNKSAVDPAYWVYQLRKVFQSYPNIQFKIYNTEEWELPTEWQLTNVWKYSLDKFIIELAN
jgi:hypothetical protein